MSVERINTVPIKNTGDLVRDISTNAVLSIDTDGLHRYKEQRRRILKQRQESTETKDRLSTLENEMMVLRTIISDLMKLKGAR